MNSFFHAVKFALRKYVIDCMSSYPSPYTRRCSLEMAGGVRKKFTGTSSPLWGRLHTLWQDKHLVLFKTEYTLLVLSVLWFLEIGINVWVIQNVACK